MDPNTSCLHPNPGWSDRDSDNYVAAEKRKAKLKRMLGKHCILELYECDAVKINDEAFIRTTITLSAKASGAKLLNLITHKFQPFGVTGLALLAESHISIHTWPEIRYAAVDVFTCGEHTLPEKACDFLAKELQAKHRSLKNITRDTPHSLV
ncbi:MULTISPECIES: adenosylmethionine decarboxylase [Prochlorococcus]|uniref:adenosylmethionine decarboxylase n=1 Tax=Prochlorococcus TaxID=1218 RepID=UPI000533931E|nr:MULTISPECIES: adenosylmethionine decarboxylase [Prochlorococcus]KGG13596.1 S-adenosylmethionine decarboxylase proenzyme [Prochlorococcus sp. MIT 0601]